jgi:hypothetical protein
MVELERFRGGLGQKSLDLHLGQYCAGAATIGRAASKVVDEKSTANAAKLRLNSLISL